MALPKFRRWRRRRVQTPTQTRQRQLVLEPLEDRRLLALLGILPGLPLIGYDQTGTLAYDASTGSLNIEALPQSFLESYPPPVAFEVTPPAEPPTLHIEILVDDTGALMGGVVGDDLVVTGTITGTSQGDLSGVLLTGEILKFGFKNTTDPESTVDYFDFLFSPTGGVLAEVFYGGQNIGVTMTSEESDFTGSFEQSFGGGAKGTIGPIEEEADKASLGDFVWEDLNADGIQDAGEPGVEGVKVALNGAGVDAVFGTEDDITEISYTDADGKYLFDDLLPGDYRVTFEPPPGYDFTLQNRGSDEARDSDADPITGMTGVVTLAPGEINLDVDAGLFRAGIDIEKYVKLLVEGGGEGLTPGYWKQCHHFDDWHDYSPYQNYNDVFGVSDDPHLTLLGALRRGGGGYKALGRHAVAALLNAAHPNIDYAFTEAQIIAMVQSAYATGDFQGIKDQFEAENELGADLRDRRCGWGGGWDSSHPGDDADTPPGPSFETGSTLVFTYVVTNNGETPLDNVVVLDDNETPLDESDDFNPEFVGGDDNGNGLLDLGETWLYTHTEVVTPGEHANLATATGMPVNRHGEQLGGGVSDDDPANWTGIFDASTIHGTVWEDADNDGVIDPGEKAIEGVAVSLTGTDFMGNPVNEVTVTDADGVYIFTDLQPSDSNGYTITESQPLGYDDGMDVLGNVDGFPVGDASVNDTFSGIVLAAGQNGSDYNFGEVPTAVTEEFVHQGQTATIGFWQNRNGQRLIKSLNGSKYSTELGDWIATEFPNLYAGLAGKTNKEVTAYYKSLFRSFKKCTRWGRSGPAKLDPQVMAVAFAVYVTNQGLAGGNYGAAYGFEVTATGLGASSFDIDAAVGAGTAETLFGEEGTVGVLKVLQILQYTDARSSDGVIFDCNGDSHLDSNERVMRYLANKLYTAINEAGDIR